MSVAGEVSSGSQGKGSRFAWDQEALTPAAWAMTSGLEPEDGVGGREACGSRLQQLTSKSTFSPSGIFGAVSLKKREGLVSRGRWPSP